MHQHAFLGMHQDAHSLFSSEPLLQFNEQLGLFRLLTG